MGRIRSIKPEFPQSESMGNVTREARLCFILLWTLADDSGRLRGSSRMLASLLYPYDSDARERIDGWLLELTRERCIFPYEVNGDHYIEICKWLQHQKIDHASPSKFPTPREDSRDFTEASLIFSLDQGSRIKEGIKDIISSDESDGLSIVIPIKKKDDGRELVRRVFDYYREKIGKSPAYKLTEVRMKKGLARFKEAPELCLALRPELTIEALPEACEKLMKYAIDRMADSDWHMGRSTDKGQTYNEWEDNLFHNAEQFSKWIEKLKPEGGWKCQTV